MESKSCRCDNDHITQVSVVILKYEALALCISHAPQRIDRSCLLMYGRWSSLFSCMLLLNHQSITEAGLFLDSQRLSILSACEGIVSVEVCFLTAPVRFPVANVTILLKKHCSIYVTGSWKYL